MSSMRTPIELPVIEFDTGERENIAMTDAELIRWAESLTPATPIMPQDLLRIKVMAQRLRRSNDDVTALRKYVNDQPELPFNA